MSQLKLQGSVVYLSGSWGSSPGAAGVHVDVVQHHALSVDTTTIWSGDADAAGRFGGTSSEWRRTRTVRVGPIQKTEPDPTDVLALTAEVTDRNGSSTRTTTFPFPWLGDTIPTPPLVLGCQPPWALHGRVNGADCYSAQDLLNRLVAALGASSQVTVELPVTGSRARESCWKIKNAVDHMMSVIRTNAQALITELANASVDPSRTPSDVQVDRVRTALSRGARGAVPLDRQFVVSALNDLARARPIVAAGAKKMSEAAVVVTTLSIAQAIVLVVVAIVVSVFSLGAGSGNIALVVVLLVLAIVPLVVTSVGTTPLVLGIAAQWLALAGCLGLSNELMELSRQTDSTAARGLELAMIIVCIALLLFFSVVEVIVMAPSNVVKLVLSR